MTMPSQVEPDLGWFDRLATGAAKVVSRAGFFSACMGLIVGWAASRFLFADGDTWQLIINTATTIITFLLVALLQNTQARADKAVQHKLNALAAAEVAKLEFLADTGRYAGSAELAHLKTVTHELRCAIGLEDRESA